MAVGERSLWRDPRPGLVFKQARAVTGGVELRSLPRLLTATAVISPTGLILAHGRASAVLLWTDGDWRFALWGSSSATTFGVAVDDHRAAAQLRPTWIWPLRVLDVRRRHLTPIETMGSADGQAKGWISMMEAMRKLLVDRPDACDRLNDPARCEQLARDLRVWDPDPNPAGPYPKFARAGPIQAAAHRAGFRHDGGRPMPGWDAPPATSVIEEVQRRLHANPSTRQLQITEAEVRQVLARTYLDATPWPFSALLLG